MDYQKIYDQLIQKRKNSLIEGYCENHHIIPRCLGGTDNTDNLVLLTAREHFIAHQLLAKIHKDHNGLAYAAYRMSMYSTNNINGKTYQWLKEHYINKGGLHHKNKTYEQIMGVEKAKHVKLKRKDHMIKMNELGKVGGEGVDNPMHKLQSNKSDEFYKQKSEKAYQTRRMNGNDKHSEETKRKISNSCKMKAAKKVELYDIDLNFLCLFYSVKEASIYLQTAYSRLSSFIKHSSNKPFQNKYYLRYSK
jgi:hypothetical protein